VPESREIECKSGVRSGLDGLIQQKSALSEFLKLCRPEFHCNPTHFRKTDAESHPTDEDLSVGTPGDGVRKFVAKVKKFSRSFDC